MLNTVVTTLLVINCLPKKCPQDTLCTATKGALTDQTLQLPFTFILKCPGSKKNFTTLGHKLLVAVGLNGNTVAVNDASGTFHFSFSVLVKTGCIQVERTNLLGSTRRLGEFLESTTCYFSRKTTEHCT